MAYIKDSISFDYNFYELFEIRSNSSTKEIIMAYENKITKFNNIDKLSNKQIQEIKQLKIGIYILINQKLRNKYNILLKLNNEDNKLSDKEPCAVNHENIDSLDSLFNIDNSWIKNNDSINNSINNDNTGRKSKNENNMLGDRVFSLSKLNKRPGYSSDFEIELRNSSQGRIDKTEAL